MTPQLRNLLVRRAGKYNDPAYFREDPIAFPSRFAAAIREGDVSLRREDVEIAAVFAAHFAWGRRAMIVRDCGRLFDEMAWRPYDYVMGGRWKADPVSVHRTVKWSDVAVICERLRGIYSCGATLEDLSAQELRCEVYGQKPDPKAPCKKIWMMKRWLVRRDGKVDLGLWTRSDPADLLIPLDVHVHEEALALGLTARTAKNLDTVREITDAFAEIFPGDPCLGDFALFGHGVSSSLADSSLRDSSLRDSSLRSE